MEKSEQCSDFKSVAEQKNDAFQIRCDDNVKH